MRSQFVTSLLFSISTALLVMTADINVVSAFPEARHHDASILRSYPMAGTDEIAVQSSIGITAVGAFSTTLEQLHFSIVGSSTGEHSGTVTLSQDRTTAIFRPDVPFALDELVYVNFTGELVGGAKVHETFSFTTVKRSTTEFSQEYLRNYLLEGSLSTLNARPRGTTASLPKIVIYTDADPMPGSIYLSSAGGQPPAPGEPTSYDMILNEHGALLQSAANNTTDFELQPNGVRTCWNARGVYFGLDTNLLVLDSFKCVNGATADGHDLLLRKDGSFSILGLEEVTRDLSGIVNGGNAAARVQTAVIQDFDRAGNLVFEWRGIDHYSVLDAQHVDLTQPSIDFEHANSLFVDDDGNYVLSNRHMSEITKIDGKTGAILWRLGGANNQFTLVNDTTGFSYQHFARILESGHLVFYDNGNFDVPQQSRAVEYQLDLTKMTATQVWEFRHDPPTYGFATGNAQRLPNGNTMIGWGINGDYTATEVDRDGKVVFEMGMPSFGGPVPLFSYRVLKYGPAAPDPIGSVALTETSKAALNISINGSAVDINVTSVDRSKGQLMIYGLNGVRLAMLFTGDLSTVPMHVHYDGSTLPSATYYAVLRTDSAVVVRPFNIVR